MLFDVETTLHASCTETIRSAIHAIDPDAQISVLADEQQVRIEGKLDEGQAVSALASVGHPASLATGHVSGGSECCGGCS